MSIHVPNGFRLNCRTIAEAEAALENAQNVAKCLAAHLVSCRFHDRVALYVDQAVLQTRVPAAMPSGSQCNEMRCSAADLAWSEIISMSESQDKHLPEVNFNLSLKLFMHDGIFYGVCESASERMLEGFMASEHIEHLGYSDASPTFDPAEVEVLQMRRRIWTNILRENGQPMNYKLVDIKDYINFPSVRMINERVVPFELRKRRLASVVLHSNLRSEFPNLTPAARNAEVLDRFDRFLADQSEVYDEILPREIDTSTSLSALNEAGLGETFEAPRQAL